MAKSQVTTKSPFKTMFKGTSVVRKKDGMHRPEGAGNFDNMDDYNIVRGIALDHGTIQHTPTNDKDILNKAYMNAGGGGDIWVEKAGDTITGTLYVNNLKFSLNTLSSTNALGNVIIAPLGHTQITSELKMTDIIDMNSNKITEVADPVNDQDAATKKYLVDNYVDTTGAAGANATIPVWSGATGKILTSTTLTIDDGINLNCKGNTILNVSDPFNLQDAATKNYVDGKTWDISSDTNLAATSPVVLTDDTLSFDLAVENNWSAVQRFDEGAVIGTIGLNELITPLTVEPKAISDTITNAIKIRVGRGGGTGGVGFGTSSLIQLENSGGSQHDAGKWEIVWDDATATSEDASWSFHVMKAGSFSEILNLSGSGVDVKTNKLLNVVDPTADQDGATKKYVDDKTKRVESIYIENPTASESIPICFIPDASTVTKVWAETDTGTVDFNIEERAHTTAETAGTDITSAEMVADDDGYTTTTFSNSAIAAESWLHLTTSATATSPTKLWVAVTYTVN